jgi:hypothetical protein
MRGSTISSLIMSKIDVEKLLFAGGADGCEFALAELEAVLKDEDMRCESEGSPRFRSIRLR